MQIDQLMECQLFACMFSFSVIEISRTEPHAHTALQTFVPLCVHTVLSTGPPRVSSVGHMCVSYWPHETPIKKHLSLKTISVFFSELKYLIEKTCLLDNFTSVIS